MATKYIDYLVSQGSGFIITGGLPVDIRTVVEKEEDLTIGSTWEKSPAYPGLIVSVNKTHEAWMFSPDSSKDYDATKPINWKKISAPDITISGRMVTVIEYNNNKYAVEDGNYDSGSWEPNDDAQPLPQSDNLEVGKTYLQLKLNDVDYVYIKSSDLIDLSNYYTKIQVDDKLSILDSSLKTYVDDQINVVNSSITEVSTRIADLSNYIVEQIEIVNSSITEVSTRIADLSSYIVEQIDNINSSIEKIDTSLVQHDASLIKHEQDISTLNNDLAYLGDQVDKINDHLDEVDSSIEDISLRLANLKMVKSVSTNTPEYLIIDPSMGDVTINVDVSTSKDSTIFQNTALVTNGYIDEKLAWVEIE